MADDAFAFPPSGVVVGCGNRSANEPSDSIGIKDGFFSEEMGEKVGESNLFAPLKPAMKSEP